MTDSPTTWCWQAAGAPKHEDCEDQPGVCWVCGGHAIRTLARSKWLGATYTGQNRVKAWNSNRICEPCVWIHSRTFPVPGRPPKEGKAFGGNWRNYTVLVVVRDGKPELTTASKGEKSLMRSWLRRAKVGPWFAAIAESGQKHVIPGAPINPPGVRGWVLFEESLVELPESFELIDRFTAALTAGLSKEGIETGAYTVAHYRDHAALIEQLEVQIASDRGSPWFELALFLAQKEEIDEQGKQGDCEDADSGAAVGTTKGAARNRSKRVGTLGPTTKQADNCEQDKRGPVVVVQHDVPPTEPASGQLRLF